MELMEFDRITNIELALVQVNTYSYILEVVASYEK